MSSVEYLGHQFDASGISPMPNKIDAVINAPPTKNVSELRSFLGLVNYYGKFVPKPFHTVASPQPPPESACEVEMDTGLLSGLQLCQERIGVCSGSYSL